MRGSIRAIRDIWAGIHAAYYLVGRAAAHLLTPSRRGAFPKLGPQLARILRIVVTFHLVAVAWIPFAAGDIAQAGAVAAGLARGWTFSISELAPAGALFCGNLGFANTGILGAAMVLWWAGSLGKKARGLLLGTIRGSAVVVEVALLDLILLFLLISGEFAGNNFMYVNY